MDMTIYLPQGEYHMLSRWEWDTGRIRVFGYKKDEVAGEICKRVVFIIYGATVGKLF
jgi:hypothetical protein